ncbi:MAG: vWA domain-containing protein [Rikenellaceae bacterium]
MIIERCDNNSNKTKTAKIEHKDIHLFLIIDTSMSIGESGITTTVHLISQIIDRLKKIEEECLGCHIYIYDIVYSNYANWVGHTIPTPVKIYSLPELTAAGLSNIGSALSLMSSELKKIEQKDKKIYFFINDGNITDNESDRINEIYNYKNSEGFSILIGHNDKITSWDAIKLVRNIDNVYYTTELNTLMERFKRLLQ